MTRRLNVTLDGESAEKLSRLAERMHLQEATLARLLLATAIDEADVDARNAIALLDSIAGAHDQALLGRDQARAGRTVAFEDL